MRRRLLRAKLAATWSVHPDAIRFHRDAAGQVCVRAPRAGFVSATQRGDMVALAVSNQPIGVDLEPNGSVLAQDIDAICPNWPALDPTTRWTAFEAFGKLVGRGLTVETNDLAAQEWTDHGLRLTWRGRKVRIDFFDYKEHRLAVAEFEA